MINETGKTKDETMQIKVNGKTVELPTGITLSEFLETNNYSPDKVLASINGEIIQPQDYDSKLLAEGCEVDLMTFVAGG